MKNRKLRIAWSVAWGLLTVLFLAWWIRSVQWIDFFAGPGFRNDTYFLGLGTTKGTIGCGIMATNQYLKPWMTKSIHKEEWMFHEDSDGFWGEFIIDGSQVNFPFWFLILVAATAATAPWFAFRFSLRTLLIGMTAAAIGLGWLVYAMRN